KSPQIVVRARLPVPVADAHLVIEGPRRVVPHPHEPVDAEPRLGGEVRSSGAGPELARELAHAREQDVLGVAARLNELQVVPRIPPPTRGVDARADGREVAVETPRAGVVPRRQI